MHIVNINITLLKDFCMGSRPQILDLLLLNSLSPSSHIKKLYKGGFELDVPKDWDHDKNYDSILAQLVFFKGLP